METRANYVFLGLFTIAAALAIILFSIWISKGQFTNMASYDVVFSGPVTGLNKGNDVRFNGIKVGDVRSLRIDEKDAKRVVARIRVDASTPVRTSSEAKLEGLGLTGVNLIQLTAGNDKDALLTNSFGAPPPRIYAKPGALDDLLQSGREVAANANEALIALRKLLNDENIAHLSSTMKNLDAATEAISKSDGAIAQVSSAANSVNKLAVHADSAVGKVDRAAGAAADMADMAGEDTLPNISAAARDLRRLAHELEQVSGELSDGQLSLIPGGAPAKPTVKVKP